MLDDEEFKPVTSLLYAGTDGELRERMFRPMLHEYERITGIRETKSKCYLSSRFVHVWSALLQLRKATEDSESKIVRKLYDARKVVQRICHTGSSKSDSEVPS